MEMSHNERIYTIFVHVRTKLKRQVFSWLWSHSCNYLIIQPMIGGVFGLGKISSVRTYGNTPNRNMEMNGISLKLYLRGNFKFIVLFWLCDEMNLNIFIFTVRVRFRNSVLMMISIPRMIYIYKFVERKSFIILILHPVQNATVSI